MSKLRIIDLEFLFYLEKEDKEDIMSYVTVTQVTES